MNTSFYIILLVFTVSISPLPSNNSSSSWEPDYWPTDEWQISTPGEQGMRNSTLQKMDDYIDLDTNHIINKMNSLLVIRNGYIVYERYRSEKIEDFYETNKRPIYSITKVFVSSMVGICLQEGYINSLEDFVLDYFPNMTFDNMSPMKERIKIKHLLTMTSGLSYEGLPYNPLVESKIENILNRPMVSEPGERWEYYSDTSHVLSTIINNVSGIGTANFTENSIFNPLGIDDYLWEEDEQGVPGGGIGLHLIPRDLARFGYLFLNSGTWDGTQLISKEYVENATRTHIEIDPSECRDSNGYGFNWFILNYTNAFWGIGALGQYLVIIPDKNLVIVSTGRNHFPIGDLITEFILPSTSPSLVPWIIGGSSVVVVAAAGVGFSILKKRRNK